MKRRCRRAPSMPELLTFAGFRFPSEVILLAVRWYLRFGLSGAKPGDARVFIG